jgi:hypothetical protein
MEKSEFMTKITSGIYALEFTKLDGSIRNMIATRNLDSIPSDKHPTGDGVDNSIGPVAVFDLEACGWRSVYPEKIISMSEATI